MTPKKLQLALKRKRPTLTVEFKGSARLTDVTCCCGEITRMSPKTALKSGCPKCAQAHSLLKNREYNRVIELYTGKLSVECASRSKTYCSCDCGYKFELSLAVLRTLPKCPRCNAVEADTDNIPAVEYTYLGTRWLFSAREWNNKSVVEHVDKNSDLKRLDSIRRVLEKSGYTLQVLFENVEVPKGSSHADIEASSRRRKFKSCVVLSFDPGVENFAWSCVEVHRPFKVSVLGCGMMRNTVRTLTRNVRQQIVLYVEELSELLDRFNPTEVIAERYMSRGNGGDTIELVNIMLGALATKHKSITYIPASQWKNAWNREGNLEEFYATTDAVAHEIDATAIGMYRAYQFMDEKPFYNLIKIKNKIAKGLVEASHAENV